MTNPNAPLPDLEVFLDGESKGKRELEVKK